MKAFFLYVGTPTPVLETELELIRSHAESGDSIRVLQCTGNLPNCHWNHAHLKSQCATCRSKFSNGLALLRLQGNFELRRIPPADATPIDPSLSFSSVSELTRYQHDGENIGYGAASTLISILRDHRFDTKKYRREITRELNTAVHVYETLKAELQDFKPDLVYFFNGRITTHLPAYLLCKKFGLEFYSYEVANKHNAHHLIKNRTVHQPVPVEEINLLRATWSADKEAVAKSILSSRRAGKDFGKIRAFTKQQTKGLLPNSFDPAKRNIAIFNSTIDEYAGIEDWKTKIYEPDETAGVYKILEAFEGDSRFMFYLRVHPHMAKVPDSTSQLVDIRKLSSRFKNLRVIWPHERIDSYALMDACEKVLTFGSTIGMEAAYWGKPSILAGQTIYENFEGVYKPDSHETLIGLLKADLLPLPPEDALKYFYWETSGGVAFKYFKETGMKNGLATGTFDGVTIRPDALPWLWYEVHLFFIRVGKVICRPSLLLRKLRAYKY